VTNKYANPPVEPTMLELTTVESTVREYVLAGFRSLKYTSMDEDTVVIALIVNVSATLKRC